MHTYIIYAYVHTCKYTHIHTCTSSHIDSYTHSRQRKRETDTERKEIKENLNAVYIWKKKSWVTFSSFCFMGVLYLIH